MNEQFAPQKRPIEIGDGSRLTWTPDEVTIERGANKGLIGAKVFRAIGELAKYNPNQPRAADGRFGSGDSTGPSKTTSSDSKDSGKQDADKGLTKDEVSHMMILGLPDPQGAAKYIAENGKAYEGQPLPQGYKEGTPNACYENATKLVMDNQLMGKGNLNYCEGVAVRKGDTGIGIGHGWAVDENGNVIDNTLKDPENYDYYGVTYPWNEYKQYIRETGFFGVLGGNEKDAIKVIDDGGISK